ncbi:uncharacterized mitochondrial protein-like protein [Tanacetum coccineum]
MQPLPTAAKSYSMLRQEEKQRETQKQHHNSPISLNTYKTSYSPSYNTPQRNNNPIQPNTQPERRGTFRKGVIYGYYKKEGHFKEECYKLLGYLVGHPLHKKYLPPSQRTQLNNRPRTVNMVAGETSNSGDPTLSQSSPLETASSSAPNETLIYAKMDQLQNQLNQVLMMMQNNQSDSSGTFIPHVAGILSFIPKENVPFKLIGIHSFKTRASVYSFIASHISNSYLIWIVDSGATNHTCISLTHMHNITNLKTPILITLPNGYTVKVNITRPVHLTNFLTLHNALYILSFTYNLTSISQLLHKSKSIASIIFTHDKFIFQDHDDKATYGTLHDGLYLLPIVSSTTTTPPRTINSHLRNLHLWHARFGHTSFPTIQKIKTISILVLSNSETNCNMCPLAKKHVLPFPISTSNAKCKFEFVHIDVWGPYDILIADNNKELIQNIEQQLNAKFSIKDLGPLHYYLGIMFFMNTTGLAMSQRKYAIELVTHARLLDTKPSTIPLDPTIKLTMDGGEPILDPYTYRTLVGKLLYLTITRPDLAVSAQALSQFLQTNHTSYEGLNQSHQICQAYSLSRRSVTGYGVFLGSSLISWQSKKQNVVSRSSTKAEYRALANSTYEITWIRCLLQEFKIHTSTPVPIMCDNISSIALASNHFQHARTKHIKIESTSLALYLSTSPEDYNGVWLWPLAWYDTFHILNQIAPPHIDANREDRLYWKDINGTLIAVSFSTAISQLSETTLLLPTTLEVSSSSSLGLSDKYYLCDAAYANTRGFLAPYRNTRYWLADFRRRRALTKEEKFNHAHAQLRNVIERSYGVLKARFPILKQMAPFKFSTQRNVVIACFAIHNFIRKFNIEDVLFLECEEDTITNNEEQPEGSGEEETNGSQWGTQSTQYMASFRDEIANQLSANFRSSLQGLELLESVHEMRLTKGKPRLQYLDQGCQDRDPIWDRFCLCKIEIVRSYQFIMFLSLCYGDGEKAVEGLKLVLNASLQKESFKQEALGSLMGRDFDFGFCFKWQQVKGGGGSCNDGEDVKVKGEDESLSDLLYSSDMYSSDLRLPDLLQTPDLNFPDLPQTKP